MGCVVMNTPTVRRAAAACAVTGLIVTPLAACSTGERTATRATPTEVWCQMHPRNVGCPDGPAPYTPTPKTSTATSTPAQPQQPGKKGTSIPMWVWLVGGGGVLFVGYRFLQGQGSGQAPAHAAYGPGSVPQPVLDYPDYPDYEDDDDFDDDEPVAPAAARTPTRQPDGSFLAELQRRLSEGQ